MSNKFSTSTMTNWTLYIRIENLVYHIFMPFYLKYKFLNRSREESSSILNSTRVITTYIDEEKTRYRLCSSESWLHPIRTTTYKNSGVYLGDFRHQLHTKISEHHSELLVYYFQSKINDAANTLLKEKQHHQQIKRITIDHISFWKEE